MSYTQPEAKSSRRDTHFPDRRGFPASRVAWRGMYFIPPCLTFNNLTRMGPPGFFRAF